MMYVLAAFSAGNDGENGRIEFVYVDTVPEEKELNVSEFLTEKCKQLQEGCMYSVVPYGVSSTSIDIVKVPFGGFQTKPNWYPYLEDIQFLLYEACPNNVDVYYQYCMLYRNTPKDSKIHEAITAYIESEEGLVMGYPLKMKNELVFNFEEQV